MPLPMLTVEGAQASPRPKAVPNLLPCRVHHTGPVDPVSAYWNPDETQGPTSVAYFRGRKLEGKAAILPAQCQGVVAARMPRKQGEQQPEPEERGEDGGAETETLQVTACFDKICVWSHEAVADAASDAYMRSIDEWLQVAGKVHSFPEQANKNESVCES